MSEPYPLVFNPIFKEKVWGGDLIGKRLHLDPALAEKKIGESWEFVDLPKTSPTGGGGQAEISTIQNGPLAGQSLKSAMALWQDRLLGNLKLIDIDGEMCFPILLKYLNSSEPLSIQTHPSAAYAQSHEDAYLKHEAWYILDAKPDAVIYRGLKSQTNIEAFMHAIKNGDCESITNLMHEIPVKKGDCFYLPSGTCHAMGQGVLAAEIQTPSDTTYRLYDWNRGTRPLHIESGLNAMNPEAVDIGPYEKRTHIAGMFTTLSRLVLCDAFRIEKVRMVEGFEQEIPYNQPTLWMVLEGRGYIKQSATKTRTVFQVGTTLLLPADLGDATVHLEEDTIWLEITFPDSHPEVIA